MQKERYYSVTNQKVIDAGELIFKYRHGSTSMIQRRLQLGYNCAAAITQELEDIGVLGKSHGGLKPREVLVHTEEELKACFDKLPNEN